MTIIGPTKKELDDLREGWNNWLGENQRAVNAIRSQMRRHIERFSNGALTNAPFDLRDWNGIEDYKGVFGRQCRLADVSWSKKTARRYC